jgi:hypothetical protein
MVTAKPKKTIKKKPTSNSKSKKIKAPPPPKIDKKKDENKGGPLDENGNPFPFDNPDGGDPICPGGYKIDYDFDPFNDPINPPFRCISSLKDPNDGVAAKMLEMANNPSAGIVNSTIGNIPALGGRANRTRRKYRKKIRNIYSRRRLLSHRRKRY